MPWFGFAILWSFCAPRPRVTTGFLQATHPPSSWQEQQAVNGNLFSLSLVLEKNTSFGLNDGSLMSSEKVDSSVGGSEGCCCDKPAFWKVAGVSSPAFALPEGLHNTVRLALGRCKAGAGGLGHAYLSTGVAEKLREAKVRNIGERA
jgi:hypothetical protein